MPRLSVLLLLLLPAVAACDAVEPPAADGEAVQCVVPQDRFSDGGVPKDAIPALVDPPLVPAEAALVPGRHRVLGVVVDGRAVAVPVPLLVGHEAANLTVGGRRLLVTYCPLTGSGLAFDRSAVAGAEFGVSGLLFANNLVLYDRTDRESLWPQMSRLAACGPRAGASLPMAPVLETTWDGWRALHPDTRIVQPGASAKTTPRRPATRAASDVRILGIPDTRGGLAFAVEALTRLGTTGVVHESTDDGPVVVFWDGAHEAAMAYRPEHDGAALTFAARDGRIVDTATGSVWRVDGRAVDGPLSGATLSPVAEAHIAFRFAWVDFHPQTRFWPAAP